VILNSILLALETPRELNLDHVATYTERTIKTTGDVISLFFVGEVIIKVIA
jgi:hypothetical protein